MRSGDTITRSQMLPKVCQQGGHTNSQRNDWHVIKKLSTSAVSKGQVEAVSVSANTSRVKSDLNAFMWHVAWGYQKEHRLSLRAQVQERSLQKRKQSTFLSWAIAWTWYSSYRPPNEIQTQTIPATLRILAMCQSLLEVLLVFFLFQILVEYNTYLVICLEKKSTL